MGWVGEVGVQSNSTSPPSVWVGPRFPRPWSSHGQLLVRDPCHLFGDVGPGPRCRQSTSPSLPRGVVDVLAELIDAPAAGVELPGHKDGRAPSWLCTLRCAFVLDPFFFFLLFFFVRKPTIVGEPGFDSDSRGGFIHLAENFSHAGKISFFFWKSPQWSFHVYRTHPSEISAEGGGSLLRPWCRRRAPTGWGNEFLMLQEDAELNDGRLSDDSAYIVANTA